jgi:hypothetical protein
MLLFFQIHDIYMSRYIGDTMNLVQARNAYIF